MVGGAAAADDPKIDRTAFAGCCRLKASASGPGQSRVRSDSLARWPPAACEARMDRRRAALESHIQVGQRIVRRGLEQRRAELPIDGRRHPERRSPGEPVRQPLSLDADELPGGARPVGRASCFYFGGSGAPSSSVTNTSAMMLTCASHQWPPLTEPSDSATVPCPWTFPRCWLSVVMLPMSDTISAS